jgi:hypothetical protein
MRVGVQRYQTLLVSTECALWRYDKAILFKNQSEVDFRISHVFICLFIYLSTYFYFPQ